MEMKVADIELLRFRKQLTRSLSAAYLCRKCQNMKIGGYRQALRLSLITINIFITKES